MKNGLYPEDTEIPCAWLAAVCVAHADTAKVPTPCSKLVNVRFESRGNSLKRVNKAGVSTQLNTDNTATILYNQK
jgi:hypothetical protein